MILQTRAQSSALSKKSTARRRIIVINLQKRNQQAEWITSRTHQQVHEVVKGIHSAEMCHQKRCHHGNLGSCEKIGWELEGYNNKKSCVSELIKRKEIIHAFNKRQRLNKNVVTVLIYVKWSCIKRGNTVHIHLE